MHEHDIFTVRRYLGRCGLARGATDGKQADESDQKVTRHAVKFSRVATSSDARLIGECGDVAQPRRHLDRC